MKTNTPPQTLQGKPSAFDKSGILGVFWGPLQFIFACTVVKYCAIALCRSRSKKRPDLSYFCFPTRPNERKQWEVFCKRADKNSRHSAIQESVHYILRKVTSRFQFLVEKVYVQNAIRLSLTQRNLRLVRVRSTFAAGNRQHRKVTRMVLILRFRKVNFYAMRNWSRKCPSLNSL